MYQSVPNVFKSAKDQNTDDHVAVYGGQSVRVSHYNASGGWCSWSGIKYKGGPVMVTMIDTWPWRHAEYTSL